MQKTIGALRGQGLTYWNQYRISGCGPGLKPGLLAVHRCEKRSVIEEKESSLAVGGFGAVLALVMVLADMGGDGLDGGVEEGGAEGEPGNVFEDVGEFDGIGRGFPPGERSMTGDEDTGDGQRGEALGAKAANDDGAGVADVTGGDLCRGECFGDGDGAVKVVGVGGAEAGDWLAGLGPCGGEFGIGVGGAADLGEFAIEQGVGVEIAGGAEMSFNDFALEIGDDQVGGGEGSVSDAAGLDDNERLCAGAVDAAGIAEGVRGEAAAGDFLIGLKNLLA